ncbi:MAG: NAD(P)/FAD-dependent oxidoreductase [Dehalococcoidia bacterium]|nr:MAG: NAD(P)/FAD-dependent oxidoreductase [Dehalococcoidia bacterium]
MTKYDFIIIGGGPNGLCVAAYLSKAGQRVLVLERHLEVGGGLATEEVTLGGFIHNTHAIYHMMVDYAPPYKDLELEKYRCHYVYPELQVVMPFSDSKALCLYSDVERSCQSIAKFSAKDAESYREAYHKFRLYMDEFLAPGTYVEPLPTLEAVLGLEKTEIGREISEYQPKSPQEIVFDLFENERVRTLMLYLACHWGLEYDDGGLGFLVPLMLDRAVNSRFCLGGSHRLSNSICRVIQEDGRGHIRGSQVIKRIIVDNGAAKGVELEDGRVYEADKAVISSIDPHQTFLKYIGEEHLSPDFKEKVQNWHWEKWSLCAIHAALEELPQFPAAADNPDINKGFMYVMGYETPDDLIEHWKVIANGELSTKVAFDAVFPTMHDPSQAPPGRHTAAMYEMAPFNLKEGAEKWWNYKLRKEHEGGFLNTLQKYAPNMTRDKVLWTYRLTPLDFSTKYLNMVQGSIKQGAYEVFQMANNRPNDECSHSRTPIQNLYVCGASVNPGGLVTFGPSYIAANVIAEDYGIDKWWQEPEYITVARRKGYFGDY